MIKNILFDIGSVLLLFDREATVREFSYYSETIPQENFTAEHVFLPEFCPGMETGEISPCEYYERFRKVSGCRVSFRHFSLIWARYFTDSRPMIALGRSLSRRFRVYFLSNTDPLHIPMLYSRFPDLLFFHGQALSYELGVLKPERSFFERALAKFALKPSECLFIDDQPQNVEAARKLGMRSIHHFNPAQTRAEIIAGFERDGISLEF